MTLRLYIVATVAMLIMAAVIVQGAIETQSTSDQPCKLAAHQGKYLTCTGE